MLLTPTEMERLVIFTAAEIARRRKQRGLKLNHPEAVAYISDAILEGAREGKTVAELMGYGATLLSSDDVMEGVASLVPMLQVEATFPDGTKLVTVHDPIRPGKRKAEKDAIEPGEIITAPGSIELNAGRRTERIKVTNKGDRPVQVGSHYHFFETNRALEFERRKAYGMRLDIPAGTAVRFEPGESKVVALVEFGGSGELYGLNGLTNGSRHSDVVKTQALKRAKDRGFRGA